MVIQKNAFWRKQYHKELLSAIQDLLGKPSELPEYLTLPVSSKSSMFEFGGSKYSSGTAMVVATPSGFPNAAIALKQRKVNGLHAASRVWVGSLIGIAHHQYGATNAAIYQLAEFSQNGDGEIYSAKFKLLVGVCQVNQSDVHDLRWLAPYDRKYLGLRRLTTALLQKLEMFECTKPIYLEPFRVLRKYTGADPDFNKLLEHTNLEIDSKISSLIPKFAWMRKNMSSVQEFDMYGRFEAQLVETCEMYSNAYPFVYICLCHYKWDGRLKTAGYVCYQEGAGKVLMFHKTGFLYHHLCMEENHSTEFEGYIDSTYNKSYFYNLLGAHGGKIDRLMTYIASNKDACHYVPLKYALCTKSYK